MLVAVEHAIAAIEDGDLEIAKVRCGGASPSRRRPFLTRGRRLGSSEQIGVTTRSPTAS
jgi:hypothetical protein